MRYIKQFVYILAFTLAGEILEYVLPLPIPAAIYGLVLMLIALMTGLLKPEKIQDTAEFLLGIMPLLFIAPGVLVLEHWNLISQNLVPIIIIVVLSTWIVFAVAGWVTQLLLSKKKGDEDNG